MSRCRMIKAILIFNNHGKPRLNKFYQYYVSIVNAMYCKSTVQTLLHCSECQQSFCFQNESQQQQIIKETFQLVSKRDDNVCNFLEGGSLIGPLSGVVAASLLEPNLITCAITNYVNLIPPFISTRSETHPHIVPVHLTAPQAGPTTN